MLSMHTVFETDKTDDLGKRHSVPHVLRIASTERPVETASTDLAAESDNSKNK